MMICIAVQEWQHDFHNCYAISAEFSPLEWTIHFTESLLLCTDMDLILNDKIVKYSVRTRILACGYYRANC